MNYERLTDENTESPGYFGGGTFYWANDSNTSCTEWQNDPSDHRYLPEQLRPKKPLACEYCGIQVKEEGRVACKQCGAPLRSER